MKKIYLVIIIFFFNACTVKEEKTVERVVEKPTPNYGPTDSGGGNGIQGRPIESYVIKVVDEKIFKQFIFPQLQKLSTLHIELAADMLHVVLDRSWFYVPVELSKIPDSLVGAHSATDQLALQSYRELWFDDIQFKKMDELSQFKLMFHELVMGVRILQFQPKLELCLAEAAKILFEPYDNADKKSSIDDKYRNYRDDCYKTYGGLPGLTGRKPISLSVDDYVTIRDITEKVTSDLSAVPQVELESLYKQLNRRQPH